MTRVLLVTGACQLLFALFLAWVMVLTNHAKLPLLVRTVKSYRDLVRAHLDYLLMALFLLAFFSVYRSLGRVCPAWAVVLACFGSSTNPLGFLIPALNPRADSQPVASPYKVLLYSAFISTTLGFGWIAMDLISATG